MTIAQCGRPIVLLSDLHVGSTVGLWPGAHRVEGGGSYLANKYQLWLVDCWVNFIEEVKKIRPRPVVVVNGDALQGVNYRDGQLITNKMDVQVEAAERLLRPLRDVAAKMYMVRGTEWHEGKAAEHLEFLAKALGAVKDPGSKQWSWWELYYEVVAGGPVIHFAHHVGVSSVPWYEATVPLRDTLLQLSELYRFYGVRAPNLRMVARSHRHRNIYVKAPPDIHVVVTPAWQLKTAFAHKKASSMLPQIGYVLIDFDGRDLVARDRLYDLPDLHVEGVT